MQPTQQVGFVDKKFRVLVTTSKIGPKKHYIFVHSRNNFKKFTNKQKHTHAHARVCTHTHMYSVMNHAKTWELGGNVQIDIGSYGSTTRYKSVERLRPIGQNTLVGATGEMSDFQTILQILDRLMYIF